MQFPLNCNKFSYQSAKYFLEELCSKVLALYILGNSIEMQGHRPDAETDSRESLCPVVVNITMQGLYFLR